MKIAATTRQIRKKEKTILPAARPNNAFKWHYKVKGLINASPSGDTPDIDFVKLAKNGTTVLGTLENIKQGQLAIDSVGISFAETIAFNIQANRHKLGSSDQG